MASIYTTLADLEKTGGLAVVCTIVRDRGSVPRHAGSKMVVYPDGHFEGTIGGGEMEGRVIREALAVLAAGSPKLISYSLVNPKEGDPGVCGGEVEIFLEPVKPHPTLLVIGGGHVGKALVHLGKWLDFRVILCDDRADFCNPAWAPNADEYWVASVRDLPQQFKFHSQVYIVMANRGFPVDVEGLPNLLNQPHAYLGVIGSRRRWATVRARLAELGVSAEQLDQVHAPMGLELNAETPEEIAVSVMAEVVLQVRGGTGEPMKLVETERD
jgi:xanthine dehydrogenase accessory factor